MAPENLPEAELDVLSILRSEEEATVRAIRESLAQRRPMTHAAVFNLLKRLEGRGLVERRKGSFGKAFIYRPRIPAEGVFQRLTGQLLDRAFGGDSVALMSSLFEDKPPSPEQLVQLEALLLRLRHESQSGGEAP